MPLIHKSGNLSFGIDIKMNMKSKHENFIEALRNVPLHMKVKLECLQGIGAILSTQDDVVWYMLLQSMSGMLNNRGYKSLMLNEENYRKLGWKSLKAMEKSERFTHINIVLSKANVRISETKAKWLVENIEKIEKIGGIEAVLEQKRALHEKSEKLDFFRQFSGIGEKYARNIWMDLYDSDFYESIAIDSRLQRIYELLEISIVDYAKAERDMLDIAHEAGLTGWELDRLLFHFTDYFISIISSSTVSPFQTETDDFNIVNTIKIKEKSLNSPISGSESRRGFVIKRLLELSKVHDKFEINVNELAKEISNKIDRYRNTISQNISSVCNIIRNDFRKERRQEFNHLLRFSVLQEKRNKEIIFLFRRMTQP